MDKDVVPSFKMPSTDSNISNTYFMNIEQPPGENAFFYKIMEILWHIYYFVVCICIFFSKVSLLNLQNHSRSVGAP